MYDDSRAVGFNSDDDDGDDDKDNTKELSC